MLVAVNVGVLVAVNVGVCVGVNVLVAVNVGVLVGVGVGVGHGYVCKHLVQSNSTPANTTVGVCPGASSKTV